MSYATPILESQTDPFWIYDAIREILEGIDLEAMSPPERTIAVIDRMAGQVGNGGFDQYFFNDGFEFPRECRKALATAGMDRMGALLERAIEIMGDGPYEVDPEKKSALDTLDQEFYKVDQQELYPKAVDFIRRHADQFAWPEGRPV